MSDTNPTSASHPGDHSEALAALERIDEQVRAAGAVEAVDSGELCRRYRDLKPLLQTALTLVQAIPIYGARIASAIRFLMSIADTLCGDRG